MAKPKNTSRFFAVTVLLFLLGAVLTATAFVLTFTTAPLVNGAAVDGFAQIGDKIVTNKLLLSQKIFYFHMPVAVISFIALLFTAIFGLLFLVKRDRKYDTRAKIVTEIALVFVMMTMVSGELWERFEWGVWWTWEPRLTTYFILMLLVIGYFILRNAVEDPEKQAVYSSVFGIIAFIDAPICFMITRIVPSSVHPVVFRTDSGLSPAMLLPLILAMLGFLCIALGLYRLRLHEQLLKQRLEALQEKLEV
jgi:heme exporter protein C